MAVEDRHLTIRSRWVSPSYGRTASGRRTKERLELEYQLKALEVPKKNKIIWRWNSRKELWTEVANPDERRAFASARGAFSPAALLSFFFLLAVHQHVIRSPVQYGTSIPVPVTPKALQQNPHIRPSPVSYSL